MKKIPNINTEAKIRFRREILGPDDSVVFSSPWQNNLILDQGLNDVPAHGWALVTRYAAIGTGTDEYERDSGTITAARATSTVTASAGFFVAGDVGSLIRWDTGEQDYITAFTSATVVTVSGSGTIAGAQFAVYHVDRNGLLTETKRTGTYTTSPDCGTSWNGTAKQITFSRTYLFSTETGAVTYKEVCWSPDAGAGANAFGAALLAGGGDSLVAGQKYKIVCELILGVSPNTLTTAPDVGTGCNTEGDILLEYIGSVNTGSHDSVWGLIWGPAINNGQGVVSNASLCPSTSGATKKIRALMQTFTQTLTETSNSSDSSNPKPDSVAATYVSGNFYRDFSATMSVSQANGSIYGVAISRQDDRSVSVKFDTPITKTSLQTFAITWRLSWQRSFA